MKYAHAQKNHRKRWKDQQVKQMEVRRCPVCKKHFDSDKYQATVDHIMPLSLGGLDQPSNWLVLCKTCNEEKGNKHPEKWHGSKGLVYLPDIVGRRTQ